MKIFKKIGPNITYKISAQKVGEFNDRAELKLFYYSFSVPDLVSSITEIIPSSTRISIPSNSSLIFTISMTDHYDKKRMNRIETRLNRW